MGAQGAGPATAPAAAAACCDGGQRAVRERGGRGNGRRCGRRAEARALVVAPSNDMDTCDESEQMWGLVADVDKTFSSLNEASNKALAQLSYTSSSWSPPAAVRALGVPWTGPKKS